MSSEKFKILEKIKKLLRLADESRGATPAEAATAAAKAQALLLEHNLTIEAVGDLEAGEKPETIGLEHVDLEATYQTSRWHSRLMHSIARPLFCRMVYYPARAGRAGSVALVGKKSNVEVCKYLYSYLYREIERMACTYQNAWREERRETHGEVQPNDSARAKIDFCLGAVETIGARLREQYRERTHADATSTALVVVSDKALDKALKDYFPRTSHTSSSRRSDETSRTAGRIAGATIPLRSGVGEGAKDKRRLT